MLRNGNRNEVRVRSSQKTQRKLRKEHFSIAFYKETRKLPHYNFFFFFFPAAQSNCGNQSDNQEKPGQVSESPGQRNQNSQGNYFFKIFTYFC